MQTGQVADMLEAPEAKKKRVWSKTPPPPNRNVLMECPNIVEEYIVDKKPVEIFLEYISEDLISTIPTETCRNTLYNNHEIVVASQIIKDFLFL